MDLFVDGLIVCVNKIPSTYLKFLYSPDVAIDKKGKFLLEMLNIILLLLN